MARELTKLHEEARRGDLAALAALYAGEEAPRGEIVLIVGPPAEQAAPAEADLDREILAALANPLGQGRRGGGRRALPAAAPRRLRPRAAARGREAVKPPAKRLAHIYGLEAEWFASVWLRLKGYRVLTERYSIKGGEIDLIVRRGATVAFVEVKARAAIADAEIAIDQPQGRPHRPRGATLGGSQSLGARLSSARRRDLSRPRSASPPRRGGVYAADRPLRASAPMKLTVAVQMDPIERIRIAGDSTFALLLEAQARGHELLYYTPERLLARRRDAGRARPDAEGQGRAGLARPARRAEAHGPVAGRRRPASAGPALRSRLYHDDPSARAHSSQDAGRQRSDARCATRRKSCS